MTSKTSNTSNTSNTRNKLPAKKLVLFFLIYSLISLFIGIFQHTRFEYYTPIKLYTVNNEIMITNSADINIIKSLNTLNREFEKKYAGDITVKLQPQVGGAANYLIKIFSYSHISEFQISKVFKDYADFIGEKNKDIVYVSQLKYENIPYENLKLKNILIKLILGAIVGLSIFMLNNLIKSKIQPKKLFKLNIVVGAIFITASLLGGTVIFIFTLFTLYFVLRIIDSNNDRNKTLTKICLAAFITRLGTAVAILFINFYRYGSYFSYFQPDEIYYYSTGDIIYQGLINFRHINLVEITGVGQYGYNLFIGIIKMLDMGDIFLTVKGINILVSIIFVAVVYDFTYKKFGSKNVAVLSSIFMAVMPTFAVFASLALRDILISFFIFIMFSQCVTLEESKNKRGSVILIILSLFFLWYFRKFAALMLFTLMVLYFVIRYLIRKRINIAIIAAAMGIGVYGLVFIAAKLYSFNVLNMVHRSFMDIGIGKFISGIVLSLVNLDFIVNMEGTIYTSSKSLILRIFYPETLFLILTFPIMGLGIAKAFKKYKSMVIVVILMFIGFISIYKIQYGGWFLRTQLQIFPFQYILIAWGLDELGLLDRIWKPIKIT